MGKNSSFERSLKLLWLDVLFSSQVSTRLFAQGYCTYSDIDDGEPENRFRDLLNTVTVHCKPC